MNGDVTIDGYRPGVLAQSIALHMTYYAPVWNFGLAFETLLAREMGEFLDRWDPNRDLFLAAYGPGGDLVGTITIDGMDADRHGAHLRWFIVSDAMRGTGLGSKLMAAAVAFLEKNGCRRCYLTTFKGLDAARALYERHGFLLTDEEDADPWSGSVGLQRFDRSA